jgi:hypothetical protein
MPVENITNSISNNYNKTLNNIDLLIKNKDKLFFNSPSLINKSSFTLVNKQKRIHNIQVSKKVSLVRSINNNITTLKR